MLIKSDGEKEKRIIENIINENPELKMQDILFREEMNFKQMLIDARREKALTQKEVGELAGLSQQAVSRLEKEAGGTIDTVIKYLYSLGMSLSIRNK